MTFSIKNGRLVYGAPYIREGGIYIYTVDPRGPPNKDINYELTARKGGWRAFFSVSFINPSSGFGTVHDRGRLFFGVNNISISEREDPDARILAKRYPLHHLIFKNKP